jgi:AcrR family transcriptional regulator
MQARSYAQVVRAESTERNRRAILGAAQELYEKEANFGLSLDLVAERAGVSSRTLLRHFGSKEGLIEAAIADTEARVARTREAPPGDISTAVRRLVDHYEEMGDGVLHQLAEAERYEVVRRVTESGTRMHLRWLEGVFASDLSGLGRRRREQRVALLASVTDVHIWGLLRRRQGLSRAETEAAIRGLVEYARGEPR